jgi:hypothetical protein
VVILIPVLVGMMLFIIRHYRASAAHLAIDPNVVIPPPRREDRVIVPVAGIDRAVVQAINVGRSIVSDVRAVVVSEDPASAFALREEWDRRFEDVPLDIIEAPSLSLVGPIRAYLDLQDAALPPDRPAPITFVIVPEFVPRHWWERMLYNQSAKRLRAALVGRQHTVVVDVPYRRGGNGASATQSVATP